MKFTQRNGAEVTADPRNMVNICVDTDPTDRIRASVKKIYECNLHCPPLPEPYTQICPPPNLLAGKLILYSLKQAKHRTNGAGLSPLVFTLQIYI